MDAAEDRSQVAEEMGHDQAIKANFDLPEAPRALGHELPLANAPVAAHRMRGETIFGNLMDFNKIV